MTSVSFRPPITGTIAICTRDRAALLRRCLASVETSIAEPGQLEVLVVDNGSSDETPRIAREWAERTAPTGGS